MGSIWQLLPNVFSQSLDTAVDPAFVGYMQLVGQYGLPLVVTVVVFVFGIKEFRRQSEEASKREVRISEEGKGREQELIKTLNSVAEEGRVREQRMATRINALEDLYRTELIVLVREGHVRQSEISLAMAKHIEAVDRGNCAYADLHEAVNDFKRTVAGQHAVVMACLEGKKIPDG